MACVPSLLTPLDNPLRQAGPPPRLSERTRRLGTCMGSQGERRDFGSAGRPQGRLVSGASRAITEARLQQQQRARAREGARPRGPVLLSADPALPVVEKGADGDPHAASARAPAPRAAVTSKTSCMRCSSTPAAFIRTDARPQRRVVAVQLVRQLPSPLVLNQGDPTSARRAEYLRTSRSTLGRGKGDEAGTNSPLRARARVLRGLVLAGCHSRSRQGGRQR